VTALDDETRAAVAALVHRLRNRGAEAGRLAADDEQFAAEYVTALEERGWIPPLAPPVDDGQEGIREAARELLAFACGTRPDWTAEETWNAIHAAKTAGLDWDKLSLRLMAIAFREETPPTRPRELWDFARGLTSASQGRPATEEFHASLAALKARNTGPMQKLTEDNDRRAVQ
jgi:hypothetical protein